MPKMKPNSGAKKRFRITGTGKIKRKHAFKNHILTKKSKDRKKRLSKFTLVGKTDENNVRALLVIGKARTRRNPAPAPKEVAAA